jgi:2-polyprenyl-3-methyl-5-hydroxy-6-metoxy-1,4-benzoquinol methylase
MSDPILDEQIQYYRARAKEYDASVLDATELMEFGTPLLLALGKFDSILELACGTGIWTEYLLRMGNEITAVDASPEMLEIARQKLGEKRINYQQADLFHWEPDRQYDLVFSANWLSHVPPTRLDKFLNAVQQSVRAGGQLAIIDQYQPSNSDKLVAKESIYATRPIEDGRQFTIVKAFHDLKFLQAKFEAFSFEVSINRFNDTFFFLTGTAKSTA